MHFKHLRVFPRYRDVPELLAEHPQASGLDDLRSHFQRPAHVLRELGV